MTHHEHAQPPCVDEAESSYLTVRRLVAAIAVGIVVLGASTALVSHDESSDSTRVASEGGARGSADGDESPGDLSQAEEDALWDEAMELHEQGWDRYGVHPIIDGTPVPEEAYVEARWEFPEPDFRAPVFDAPDGDQIGWHYSHLGFLTLEQAADRSFDAAAARAEKYGCDIQLDIECRQSIIADAEAPD